MKSSRFFNRFKRTQTVGSFLTVSLPMFGIKNMSAKVDTGAFSGAVHATGIKVIQDDEGNTRLSFIPHGKKRAIKVDSYHYRRVKSSNGQVARRYAVDTEIEIYGNKYPNHHSQ
jgi:hypothetical protein